jgi:GT2 family glycosyltransferase/pyruvate-formate lyase-activating enzyme
MTEKELQILIARFIQNSIYFNDKWYREKYHVPDTTWAASHYFLEGWKCDFDPSEYFSTREYLEKNQDVLKAGINPLFHYECYGKYENDRYPKLQDNIDHVIGNDELCNHRIENGLLRLRITNRCNGRCRYCGLRGWSQEEQRQEMDPKWYYEYCKPLYEKLNIVLVTGGDAYVARESYNYMEFLSKNYPQITIATESNGIAFSKKFRELACENLFKAHFSINASNAETFLKGCWEGPNGDIAYEKSLENIRAYVALLKGKDRLCFAPSLSMVINKDTAHDVVDFARLALSLHAFSVNYYFDYTENDMESPNFGNPETSRPALKRLMEIERVLAGKVHIYFRLWIPHEEPGRLQADVEATPINELREKYRDFLELAKNRSMIEEFKERDRIRREYGKRLLTMEEDYSPTIRMTDIGGKSVCFAAWSELDLYPNGRIDFCGWYRPTLNIKNFIKNDTLDWNDILNSDDYKICRRNILNDNFQGCMSSCPMNSCTSEIVPPFRYGLDRVKDKEKDEFELINITNLRSEQEIMKSWKDDISKPLVSISCITYNHERYIRECLDGFLQQKTTFPIEVLIHEDASTDGTAAIIKEYAKKYPTIIKPTFQKENQFSKGILVTIDIYSRAKGKYLAVCEGDDYWTDPLKLQKQVEFLEAHPECSICFHPVVVRHEDNSVHDYIFPHPQTHPFVYRSSLTELKHLVPFNYIQTNSVMYRWRFYNESLEDIFPRDILPGDWFLHLLHAEKGKIGFIDEVMAVYRRHSGGIWWEAGRNQENFFLQNGLKHLACYQAIERRWPEQISPQSKQITTNFAADVIRVFLKTPNYEGLSKLKQQFPEYYDRGTTYLLSLHIKLVDEFQSEKNRNACLAQENIELRTHVEKLTQKLGPTVAALREKEDVNTPSRSKGSRPGPLVSIIIPLFNKVEFTRKCLESLFQNTPEGLYELIMIDNASTDSTKTFLQTIAKNNMKVIINEKNQGFAKACNQGANAARSRYVLFLNNDTEPLKGWLEPLLDIVEKDDSVAAVGSKLLYPDMTIQHAGVVIVNDEAHNDALQARNNHVNKPANMPEANEATLYQALTAACVLIRKTAFVEAGGFDEEYWNGYEDVDLCFKLQEQGGKLVYQPVSVVIHHESKSGPERFAKAPENINRLHMKWINKIKPDIIMNQEGSVTLTDAQKIHPYSTPGTSQTQQIPISPKQPALVSIIILTHNQLEHTKRCLDSIEAYTSEPYELILVDNGSTDGTPDYLQKYANDHSNVRMIANKKNLGFAAGNNQGMAVANGNYLLLLNNDTVVTKGWLARMLSVFERYPEVGIVGPVSNYVSGPQQVKEVSYRSLEKMHHFAKKWSAAHMGQTMEFYRVVGFCLLAKREVIDKIGGLDEQFGSGNFEDDDFCFRAAAAGYKARIAQDAFVHHTGSQTFKGAGIDYRKSLERNWEIFKKKWKLPQDLPYGASYKMTVNTSDLSQYYIPIIPVGAFDKASQPEQTDGNGLKQTSNQLQKLIDQCEAQLKGQVNNVEEIAANLYKQAVSLQEIGRTDLSLKQFELILEITDNNPEVHNDIGVLYFQKNIIDKALHHLKKAVELTPDNIDYQMNLAEVYMQTGKLEEAIACYQEALERQPDNIEASLMLARLSSEAGLKDATAFYFSKVLEIEPDNAEACQYMAGNVGIKD